MPYASSAPAPAFIPQDDDGNLDENQQRYNLRSLAQEITNSVINHI